MKHTQLIRLGGLAAMVGGVVYAGVGLVEERLAEYLYYMGNIGGGFVAVLLPLEAMAAIAALHALQRELYGRAGAVSYLTAFVGLALATGALTVGVVSPSPDLDSLSNALVMGLLVATAGIVLLGGLTIATGTLPRWSGVALIAGSPLGVFAMMLPSAALEGTFLLGAAFQALGGVPWVFSRYCHLPSSGTSGGATLTGAVNEGTHKCYECDAVRRFGSGRVRFRVGGRRISQHSLYSRTRPSAPSSFTAAFGGAVAVSRVVLRRRTWRCGLGGGTGYNPYKSGEAYRTTCRPRRRTGFLAPFVSLQSRREGRIDRVSSIRGQGSYGC